MTLFKHPWKHHKVIVMLLALIAPFTFIHSPLHGFDGICCEPPPPPPPPPPSSPPPPPPPPPPCEKEEKPPIPPYLIPLSLKECGDVTFVPGVRIQARYLYDDEDHNNDFFIRRFRLKASGDVFGLARYGMELKIDNTGRFKADPKARVENAWIDFILGDEVAFLRVGLYDIPISRNALTSDSKLLFMDRSLIKLALTAIGFADNTIGIMLHGRPFGGHLEYYVGIFDNERFEKFGPFGRLHSDELQPAARLVWNFFDPATPPYGYADYWETYICQGHRLAIGINGGYLGSAIEEFEFDDEELEDEDERFDISVIGMDIFYNYYRFTFVAEYDWYNEDKIGYGWYAAVGYLIWRNIEIAARYQELKPTRDFLPDKLRWTSIGANYYYRKHNLKIQTDYTFKREKGDSRHNDVFEIQLQFDY